MPIVRSVMCTAVIVTMAMAAGAHTALALDAWKCAPSEPAATAAPPVAADPVTAVDFSEEGGELTVFTAASLTDAFDEIGATLEDANPGLTITLNLGGSQALVTQLTEGAPADVAALAANAAMTDALETGFIDGDPREFAQNLLTVVVPTDNPAGIDSPGDLGQEGIKLVLAAGEVPAGQYARASVCLMAEDRATYGDDFVTRVAENVVSEEENVRAVLTKVALGEADAGIVYTSDVNEDVVSEEIPGEFNVLASYPIAAVAGGNADLAAAFISYVLSAEGQAILDSYGFIPVN